MDKLSFALESYLDAVYELSAQGGGGARLTDIALRMGVTKPTANAAMSALAGKGLVEHGHYSHIRLTKAGAALAKGVTRKHETIRRFLQDALGLDDRTADADACAIEHTISDKAVAAMRKWTGGTP